MKTKNRPDVHVAMARLRSSRPSVVERSEGVVPRAERARLLASIMEEEAAPVSETARSSEPGDRLTSPAGPGGLWSDLDRSAPGSRRRPLLAAALVAATVAAGLGVAGLVAAQDDTAQVSAGPGDTRLPSLAPGAPAGYLPGDLPEGIVLQEVTVEASGGVAAEAGAWAEVYGRDGSNGQVDQAVAVFTATAPDAFRPLLDGVRPVQDAEPDKQGRLSYDFGQGLLATSFSTDEGVLVLAFGRGLTGGSAELSDIVDDVVVGSPTGAPGERIDALSLVADGYALVYEGDQIPGLAPGTRTALRYGDGTGERSVTLWLEDGLRFEPAALAWMYPETRPVEVRGREGLLASDGLLTSVIWQERPDLALALDVNGFSGDEAVALANGVREVGADEWSAVGPTQGPVKSVVPDAVASGPEVVLGEGRVGDQPWELVGFPIEPGPGNGANDRCTSLRVGEEMDSVTTCSRGEKVLAPGSNIGSLGSFADVGGRMLVTGELDPNVAVVRFLSDSDDPVDVPVVGRGTGYGVHVVADLATGNRGYTAVLLDDAGTELERLQLSASGTIGVIGG